MKLSRIFIVVAISSIFFSSVDASQYLINKTQESESKMLDKLAYGLKNMLMDNKNASKQYQKFIKSDIVKLYRKPISFDAYIDRIKYFYSSLEKKNKTVRAFAIFNAGGGFNEGKVDKLPSAVLVEKLSNRYVELSMMHEDILNTIKYNLSHDTIIKNNYQKFMNKYPKSDALPDPDFKEYKKNLMKLAKKLSENPNAIDGFLLPSLKDMYDGFVPKNWTEDMIEYNMIKRVSHRQYLESMSVILGNKIIAEESYKEYISSYDPSLGFEKLNFSTYVKTLKSSTKSMKKYDTFDEWLADHAENVPSISDLTKFFPGLKQLLKAAAGIKWLFNGILKIAKIMLQALDFAYHVIMQILNWISLLFTGECFECDDTATCDKVLECAMEQQRKSLAARLDDLKTTIKANTKQTIHQTKIIKQELDHYVALLARVKKENEILSKAVFLSKKIRDSESLGVQINAIGKGK